MDINDLRIATTLLSLVLFLGLWVWTWSRRRQAGFAEAARLPFVETTGELPTRGSPALPASANPAGGGRHAAASLGQTAGEEQ